MIRGTPRLAAALAIAALSTGGAVAFADPGEEQWEWSNPQTQERFQAADGG